MADGSGKPEWWSSDHWATAPLECPSCHVMAGMVDRLRVRGVGRDPDDARTLVVAVSGEFSDDDLRSIHDHLRGWRP